MIKKILLGLFTLIILFILVILVRTVTFSYDPMEVELIEPVEIPESAVLHLQQSVQFKTISYAMGSISDSSQFENLIAFFGDTYPLTDSLLKKEQFGYSLLYTWEGTEKDLDPVVLMAHTDVVPVDENTLDEWTAPPFEGKIVNGNIYGRGSLDDKMNVIACLESVEMLLASGYTPKRTIYLVFGHDEEVGGEYGAKVIAEHMKEQGITPAFVMDEGGFIAEGMIDGVSKPLAMINTGEKGYVSYKISIKTSGGHSSNPPADNTIGSLATAITKLEQNQMKYKMIPVIEEQIGRVGPEFEFVKKMAFANTWLFGEQILKGLNAHTTTAPTIIAGGVKDNVIPTEASVVVNFRIMPGENMEMVKNHVITTINDDRFTVEAVSNGNEPSKISDHNTEYFQLVEKTIRQLNDDVVVSPGLLGAGTDSKHFIPISDNVYRFFPTRITPENVTGFHGTNEHISVDNFKETVQFVHQLMLNL